MATIKFDKKKYKAGEGAIITYRDAPSDSWIIILPTKGPRVYMKHLPIGGSDSFEYCVPTTLDEYDLRLWLGHSSLASDKMQVAYAYTNKVTPSTIGVVPGIYNVVLELSGYKDKIILDVVVLKNETKKVTATLEPEGGPPVTKTVTFGSAPSGSFVTVIKK